MNDNEYKSLIINMEKEIENGYTQDQIANKLKQLNVSIITAIRANKELFNISLGQSKEYISSHPAWIHIHQSHEKFHDQLYEMLLESNKD